MKQSGYREDNNTKDKHPIIKKAIIDVKQDVEPASPTGFKELFESIDITSCPKPVKCNEIYFSPSIWDYAENGNVSGVSMELSKGFDVNIKCHEDQMTPLMCAVQGNQIDTVNFLLLKGADIHALDQDGECALIYAIKNNSYILVELLLSRGANANALDSRGCTALMCSIRCRNALSITKCLLKMGKVDVNKAVTIYMPNKGLMNQWTALMFAVFFDNIQTAELLLYYGADINMKNSVSAKCYFNLHFTSYSFYESNH